MVGTTSYEPEQAQVKVTFTTTEDGIELPESKRQLLVPAGTLIPADAGHQIDATPEY